MRLSKLKTPTAALDKPSPTKWLHLDMFSNSDVDKYQNPQDNNQTEEKQQA